MKLSEYWNLLKLFFKIKGEIKKMEKSSWKSTAGILNILSIILTVYAGFQSVISAELAAKIGAALVMVFTVANAIVKFTPAKADDELLAKIEEKFKERGIGAVK